jgi:ATP-dependent DNA ligase
VVLIRLAERKLPEKHREWPDWTERVPSIVEALRSLRAASVTSDGEAMVCDPHRHGLRRAPLRIG